MTRRAHDVLLLDLGGDSLLNGRGASDFGLAALWFDIAHATNSRQPVGERLWPS